jgi:rare lipoprotein A
MPRHYALPLLALSFALAACSTAPVNPITRLPPQTKPVPRPENMPAFGSDDFNRIKDAHPDAPPDVSQVPDARPVEEPRSRYGNKSPYKVLGATYHVLPTARGYEATGNASWYGKKFHGLRTSSGEKYDMYKMTAAHRSLPLPSYARVTNLANGRSVIVKVNDRGPFHSARIMDLSYAAAARLDMIRQGTARVKIEALEPAEYRRENEGRAQQQAPAPEPVVTAASAAAMAGGLFFVQVGAFSEVANATALQEKILGLVQAPVAIAHSGEPTPVNRVQVGPFGTREEADRVAQLIREHALGSPIVVNR